jgi:hypothetical protein
LNFYFESKCACLAAMLDSISGHGTFSGDVTPRSQSRTTSKFFLALASERLGLGCIHSTYHNSLCSLYMLVRNFRMTGISIHRYIDIFGSKRHLLALQMQSLAPASLKTCFQTSDEHEFDQYTLKIARTNDLGLVM